MKRKYTYGMSSCHGQGRTFEAKIMYKKCELEKRTATALRLLNNQTLSTNAVSETLYTALLFTQTHTLPRAI